MTNKGGAEYRSNFGVITISPGFRPPSRREPAVRKTPRPSRTLLRPETTGNGVSKLVFTILAAVTDAERDRTHQHHRTRGVSCTTAKMGRRWQR